MAGVLTGSFFMGGLGDKYGRFPVLLGAQGLCSVFGLISSFANTWLLYSILRYAIRQFSSGVTPILR